MKTLRLIVFAIVFVLFGFTGKAQWVSIPDDNFGSYLYSNGCSQCMQWSSSLWLLDTTCAAVMSKIKINCSNEYITDLTGIQYFDNLDTLICSQNSLATLPALPNNLRYLDCIDNLLTTLPPLPETLESLICEQNQIATLPSPLPNDLIWLDCILNNLSSLPQLPNTLQTLWCSYNNLTTLPVLPNSILSMDVGGNPITGLPQLPPSLKTLIVDYTSLPGLPSLPNALQTLRCARNSFTSLPPLPSTLRTLDCSNTLITTLPELPGYMFELTINNTNIVCLPELKTILNFQFNHTNISCLPNYPTGIINSNPLVDTVPLCNYFNTNGCPVYYNITGKAYEDANANCINDATESGLDAIKIQLWQNGTLLQQTIPAQGLYSFDVTNYGAYQVTIDTTNIPFRIKCPASGSLTSVISAADSMDYNMDFALECKPGFDLEAKSIGTTGVFRPANFATMEVAAGDASNFYNGHCAAGVSGAVTLSFTGPAKFISAAPNALTPTVTGNTLTYNIANFGTVNFFEDFDVVMQTDTFAQANQQVCFTLNVTTPTSGDNNPANNTFNICYTVVNSYDPNDKQVYPDGNIDTAQRELVYTIRFQNTGTAEAIHIYITDTLSSHINPASFQLLAYSHTPMVQLDGNRLRFNFPNINLPDSTTNEPASHGYVQFKVKLNNGLPVGTVINNTAFIYFDFNAPVVTNTTTNTIYVPAPPAIKPISIGKYRIDRGVKPNGRL